MKLGCLLASLIALVMAGAAALAQDRTQPICKTREVVKEIGALKDELGTLETAVKVAYTRYLEATKRLADCEGRARRENQNREKECLQLANEQAAARDAYYSTSSRILRIRERLKTLEALPPCAEASPTPDPKPPTPDPKPPVPDPKPPGAVPRNITITHRGSCPACGEIAAKFNKAADEYAAAVNRGTLDEPLMKAEMEELGRELDACEKQCRAPSSVPGVTITHPQPPSPPREHNLDNPPASPQAPGAVGPPKSSPRAPAPSALPPSRGDRSTPGLRPGMH